MIDGPVDRRSLLATGLLLAGGACSPGDAAAPRRRTLFGANCYDLFYRSFYPPAYQRDPAIPLRELKDAGIGFVRFSASAFYASEWRRYFDDPSGYFAPLDRVFEAADEVGMPIVPSLLWYPGGVSDRFGEPYSAWGDARSQTRRFMDRYVPEVVRRYRRTRSVMMWEFSNEMNAFADRQQGERFFPPINVKRGSPARRTPADRITATAVAAATARFAALVRSTGDTRPIGSGADMPRVNQVSNGEGRNDLDTRAELMRALETNVAGGCNMLSVHLYPNGRRNRFSAAGSSYGEMLEVCRSFADRRRLKLFVGEFGVSTTPDEGAARAEIAGAIAAIRAAGADYAAFWVYDMVWRDDPYNVTSDNGRAWVLDAIRKANAA